MSPTTTTADTRFGGFPDQMFEFLEGLEADNTKTYWTEHNEVWKGVVSQTVTALMEELEPEFGSLRTFRPNRDVRFSADKSLYKTWVGITTTGRAVGGVGHFVRVDPQGIRVAGGAMVMASDQLTRYREAVVSRVAGAQFTKIREAAADVGLTVGPGKEGSYKRIPAGYDKDDPREELLRWKGAVIVHELPRAKWMAQPKSIDRIREVWTASIPLVEWIEKYVGASDTPSRRQ